MRRILIGLLLLVPISTASAKDVVYEGTWVTTNSKLEGTLRCVVTDRGENRWRGCFSGDGAGRPFSYTVDFSGPADKVRGTAVIDGADYEWTGSIDKESPGSFNAKFSGSRYTGGFNLKQVK
jgi:hypothetical protein